MMVNKEFRTLVIRSLTGLVFIGIIISALWFSSYATFVVFGIAMYVCFVEFMTMTSRTPLRKSTFSIMKGLMLFLYGSVYLFATGTWTFSPLLIVFPPLVVIAIVSLYDKSADVFGNVSHFTAGLIYTVLPFAMANIMINDGQSFSGVYLLAIFAMIWANDSFAYVFGVSFGKHRMWERISPKKSWEGFIGGGISTVIFAVGLSHFFFPEYLVQMLGVSVIVVVMGTFGDLFESKLKRQFGVKDSGNSLPGHGGFLDRFDSFLFIVPIAMLFIEFVG